MGSRITLYRNTGVVLVRASTDPGGLELPENVDLNDDAVAGPGRVWLARLWRRDEVRAALRVASPALSQQIDTMLSGDSTDARDMRRVLVSASSYLLRWRRRPTPFGLFAGVAAASASDRPTTRFGHGHRVTVRADARWLGGIIDRLERHPEVLLRLPILVNNAGFTRGDRFVVPARPDEAQPGRGAALDTSVRHTRAVRAALAGAAEPVRVAALAQRIGEQFPGVPLGKIHALLAELVASRVLITSLRAPMTTVDTLAHLVDQLETVGAGDLPDIADLLKQLAAIRDELSHPSSLGVLLSEADPALKGVAERMKAVHGTAEKVLAVDVALDCQLTVPDAVIREAEAAATTLLRLTPHPFGSPAWKDFHAHFRDRYGTGAVVPVRDVVADSGLGFPAGFLGAPRPHPPRALTERDGTLLALIQQAVVDGRAEIELTEPVIRALTVGDHAQMIPPPRVELALQLHAASPDALACGQFQLWVTGAPMQANSMAGRFAHLLSEADQRRLADTYTPACDHAVAVQLSFPPRREHNENITRAPRLLPRVISLAEHRADDAVIRLDDLAVTTDASQLYLMRISTGERIQPHVLHSLETSAQTPPLARFLAEVASARCGVYGPFDFGVARAMPFLPRVRCGRSVLAPARWLLNALDLPHAQSTAPTWEKALSGWRDRWRIPSAVVLCEGELRLPLDLDDRLDRVLLRTRLDRDRTGRVELREAGDHDGLAWVGRACELLVTLDVTRPRAAADRPPTAPQHTVTRSDALLPGHSAVLHAQLLGHPLRFDEILTDHLSFLLDDVEDHMALWWFRRHHDTTRPDSDQHLVLCLRLRGPQEYGVAAARLADWAARLSACGLLADLNLVTYQPQRGGYGHGAAMETATEGVFAADSAAALAQIRLATDTGMPNQAIAAASMSDVAASLAATPEAGHRWLVDLLPQEHGKLDSSLREAALQLASVDDWAELRGLPGGQTVAEAWDQRREALAIYREQLSQDGDQMTVLRSLLHDHHVRAVGVDPGAERVTNRLARAVAQRQMALIHRSTP